MVQLVRQEHSHECGIACIAMVAGLTLEQARAAYDAVYPDGRANGRAVSTGITYVELDAVLAKLGLATARLWAGPKDNRHTPWPPAPFADTHIEQRICSNGAHFVVVLRDGSVLDPAGSSMAESVSFLAAVTRVCESMLDV